MWRATRTEEAMPVHATDELLLAYYDERYNRICEEMPQLLSAS